MKIIVWQDPYRAGSYDWNVWEVRVRSRLFMREKVKVGMMKYIRFEGLYMPARAMLINGVTG